MSNRPLEHIPLAELANAAEHVLWVSFGLPRDELFRETAALFGVGRLGPNVRARLAAAIDELCRQNRARAHNDSISLSD